ncbi:MAG: replicative DNA helicase [Deltaproteobacteria bacterium]|nr:replicative DNA helicase [Deltaproteobacteria bacterium]
MAEEVLAQKVPPQNIDAERAVLGGILLDNTALDRVVDQLKPDDFYRETHRKIFRAILALSERSDPFDLVTVSEALAGDGALSDVGGPAYLSSLVDEVPSAVNIDTYSQIVREKAVLRRLIAVAGRIASDAFGAPEHLGQFLDDAEKQIFDITQARARTPFVAMKDAVREAYKRIEEINTSDEEITGLSTGYSRLDEMTAGLQPGNLIIIAGRPGMGKTSLALNIAEHAAIRKKAPVIVFSLEMDRNELAQRMLSSEAGLGLNKFRFPKRMEVEDWGPLSAASDKLSQAPIFVDDSGSLNVLEMRGKARRLKHEQGGKLGLIVVDYLQLMRGHGRADNREQEISEISRSLKALAKELRVPIIALSQLNREPEKRTGAGKKPVLADLRESGSIEQDADVVIFIYRPEVYEGEAKKGQAEIIVAKQRNGETGSIHLRWVAEFTRFETPEFADSSPPPGAPSPV